MFHVAGYEVMVFMLVEAYSGIELLCHFPILMVSLMVHFVVNIYGMESVIDMFYWGQCCVYFSNCT